MENGNCLIHNFDDFCLISERNYAFVAPHLNEPITAAELYKESYPKEKLKTVNVALVICLNMDIDPPDVQKIPPYSRVEAWIDPSDAGYRVVDMIGKNLQMQYERWQPKACYRQCLDPNLDDVKKICINLRRNARTDRILFHYNGHGVPRPTENGEIWVFNRTFTKYIPLSLYDLQRWLGCPSVYVIDCQNAGRVLKMYEYFCQRKQTEAGSAAEGLNHEAASNGGFGNDFSLNQGAQNNVTMENTIMLCACQENEDLPQLAELPADLFTACLTTPIRTALKWHWMKYNKYFPGYIEESLLEQIPGSPGNRMSLLGEINWIFTAVTDTIAWCSFHVELFQKLFRQDLLVASLYRNYLLAERLMRDFGCTPCSWPKLNPTHDHPMWRAWDHALDLLFHYLPQVLRETRTDSHTDEEGCFPLLLLPDKSATNVAGSTVDALPPELTQLTSTSSRCLTSMLKQVERLIQQQQKLHRCPPVAETPKSGHPGGIAPVEGAATDRQQQQQKKQTKFVVEHLGETPVVQRGEAAGAVEKKKRMKKKPPVVATAAAVSASSSSAPATAPSQSHCPPPVASLSVRGGPQGAESSGSGVDGLAASGGNDVHRGPLPQEGCEGNTESSSDVDESEEDDVDDDDEEEDEDDDDEDDEEEEVEGNGEGDNPSLSQHWPNVSLITARRQLIPAPIASVTSRGSLRPSVVSSPWSQIQPQQPLQKTLMPSARTIRSGLYAAAAAMATASANPEPLVSSLRHSRSASLGNGLSPGAQSLPPSSSLPAEALTTVPDYRPVSFFTSQMTALEIGLRQAAASREKTRQMQTATQLPILLQVLLSQTHRIRALQLLSEFLDLGSWSVSYCITVGILPYIVRLFNSNVAEVRPHLVFIWAKIISSAQIDFGRHEGIRESGYKYFVNCLRDVPSVSSSSSSLSVLVRAMSAFALAKMLIRVDSGGFDLPDPVFQQVYCTSKPLSFIQIAAEELKATSGTSECHQHLRTWLLLALGRLWFRCDEARWHAVRSETDILDGVLFPLLEDPAPMVRASAVFALGCLTDNYASDPRNVQEAERLSHQVGVRLLERTQDPSFLVRCELVVALCSFVRQCEGHLIQQAYRSYEGLVEAPSPPACGTPADPPFEPPPPPRRHVSQVAGPFGSPPGAASVLWRSLHMFNRPMSRSQRDLQVNVATEAADVTCQRSSPQHPTNLSFHLDQQQLTGETPFFDKDYRPPNWDSIFARLWHTIATLANDPHPSVSKLANPVLVYVVQKLILKHNLRRQVSLIDGRVYRGHLGDTLAGKPPVASQTTLSIVGATSADQNGLSHTILENCENRTEDEKEEIIGLEHVKTDFFDWCSKWFSHPLLHKYPSALKLQTPDSSHASRKTSVSSDGAVASSADRDQPHSIAAVYVEDQSNCPTSSPSRFSKNLASRSAGRQRWHSIAMGQAYPSGYQEPSTASTHPESPLPSSSSHLNGGSTDRLSSICSGSVVSRVPLAAASPEDCLDGGGVCTGALQVLHVFECGVDRLPCPPVLAKFHPYKPHLLVAERSREHSLTLWGVRRAEWVQRIGVDEGNFLGGTDGARRLSGALTTQIKLQQKNPAGVERPSHITGLEVVNTTAERSLVLTACGDGHIRVWQNYDGKNETRPKLLSAWVAFENLLPLTTKHRGSCGVVTHWSEFSSLNHLLVSGDVRVVRLFDVDREAVIRDLPTHSEAPVSRLARADDNLLAAGFVDGTVKLFDARIPTNTTVFKDVVRFRGVGDDGGGSLEGSRGDRILDLSFAPYQANRRFYAVSSSGWLGSWQHSASSSPSGCQAIVQRHAGAGVGAGSAAHQTASVACANFQVSLPCTRSHMLAHGDARRMCVTRLHDGKVIGTYRPTAGFNRRLHQPSRPTCIAFNAYESLIALGMSDASVHLLKFRAPS